jgi:isopenicillin-N N-acyltransferase-like protein
MPHTLRRLSTTPSTKPPQIGHHHGTLAAPLVRGSIAFYTSFFRRKASLTWPEACTFATQFTPFLTAHFPAYLEEMRGLAAGAGTDLASVLALNVRTEIGYGLATDGCTAFGWKSASGSFLAQNWDWEAEQSANIISLHISKQGCPAMHFMSEAGIIGKIGMNAAGVGVTLNAIAARGVDVNRLPCHLALRTVLECHSREEAVGKLLERGVASSCHIQIADKHTGGVGLENTSSDTVLMTQDDRGIIAHSNHFVFPHKEKCANKALPDSVERLDRIRELLGESMEDPSVDGLKGLLKDERGYPTAICRATTAQSSLATLFSTVMDLGEGYAVVKMGRPTEGGMEIELRP